MILCITPNPAIDRTLVVPGFTAGHVFRATSSLAAAGGKGINVARAARLLGAESLCAGFLGGDMGRIVATLAASEGLAGEWTWIDGETRTCIIVTDADTGEATVINEQGPSVTAADWERLTAAVAAAAAAAANVCFSGSLPPGSPLRDYADLIIQMRDAGKSVWVDTSGAPLEAVRGIPGISIKVNGREIGDMLNQPVNSPAEAADAAAAVLSGGAERVVLTLGKDGAVLADKDGTWWAEPPALRVVNPIGSGDSFLAGLVVAVEQGLAPAEALSHGVAAGAANALSVGGGRFSLDEFETIRAATGMERL